MPDLRYKALLIGNATFPLDPGNLQPLQGPHRDVELLKEAITDPDAGLFASDNVKVLADQSKLAIAAELERFFTRATREDRLLLYYSGHGLLDQRNVLHLCAHDTQTDILKASAISANDINAMFDSSAAQTTIIVLDCCHSGAFKSGNLQDSLTGEGRFLLTSCRGTELAADADLGTGSSVFTKHLVDGLRSGAPDRNQDGYVSLSELYDFVHHQLREGSKQIPQRNFAGGGDPAIAARDAAAKVLQAPPVIADDPPAVPVPAITSPPWWQSKAVIIAAIAAVTLVLLAVIGSLSGGGGGDGGDDFVDETTETIEIHNVYNLPQDRAESILNDQGFSVSAIDVCSNSVAPGRVRQVFQDVDGEELILVDEDGVSSDGEFLDPGEEVLLKVSTGPCESGD